MKQLIIIFMSVLLGIYIFNIILGDEEDTVKSASSKLIQQQLELQKMEP